MNWTATTVSTQNIARGRGLRPRFNNYEGPRNGDYARYVDELMRWAEQDRLLAVANTARAAAASVSAASPSPARQTAQTTYGAAPASSASSTRSKPSALKQPQTAEEKQRARLERKLAQKEAQKKSAPPAPEVKVAYRKSSQSPAYMPLSESMQQELPEDAEPSTKSKVIFWSITVLAGIGLLFVFPGITPILITIVMMMVIGSFSKDKGKDEQSLKTPK